MSLFDSAAEEELERRAPLAARMRPASLEEVIGQEHLVGPDGPLRAMLESDRLCSIVLWGPPGSGKTTLARLIAKYSSKAFVPISAVTAGVRDVREAADEARRRLGQERRGTVLFVDEVHRFNRAQQDVLLPFVEEGLVVFVGATTENPFFSVNGPLLSRSLLLETRPLAPEAVAELLVAAARRLSADGGVEVELDDEVVREVASASGGDARKALTVLEVLATQAMARSGGKPARVSRADLDSAGLKRTLSYTRDSHYDMASALIKSVRGSDPDAAVYWLARILASGGDARFVARRLVIAASEDVGEADPGALGVAVAAAQAVELVGLPEAALNLAQAAVHLATAPKSNRCAVALWRAEEAISGHSGAQPAVPAHLRDSHYEGASRLAHGVGYAYPHDDPRGWVRQRYLPPEVAPYDYLPGEGPFYRPSSHGVEAETARRLSELARRAGDQPQER